MEYLRTVIHHTLTDVIVTAHRCETSYMITEVRVGSRARQPSVADDYPEQMTELTSMLMHYLNGMPIDFSSVSVDFSGYTPFQAGILKTARTIPYGTTLSYSELAAEAGFPKAARAVGSVMRRNRYPLIIPCHRVIRKNGAFGAYCGDAAGNDARLKQLLLRLEQTG